LSAYIKAFVFLFLKSTFYESKLKFLQLLVDSSSYLCLVDSGRVARGFECCVHGFKYDFPT